MITTVWRWWCEPLPVARIAWLRRLAYLFVIVDVFFLTSWIRDHLDTPTELYHPLLVGRVLSLPVPTPTVIWIVLVVLVSGAALALSGRAQRSLGWLVFAAYAEWMVIAFSYGKVDHDRFAFLVLLAVLPTAGRATTDSDERHSAAGWAIRSIQVACVATYFLSVWGKFRFGGLAWLNSAALLSAVLRRGTSITDILADHPWTLQVSQYLLVAAELASPLLLAPRRAGRLALGAAFLFHVVAYATVKIAFYPHVLALCAFLPLERLPALSALRRRGTARGTTHMAARSPA